MRNRHHSNLQVISSNKCTRVQTTETHVHVQLDVSSHGPPLIQVKSLPRHAVEGKASLKLLNSTERLPNMSDPYAVLSVCSTLGTLHIHHPHESVPRLSQTSCRLRHSQALTIDPTSTTIIASCENASASSTALTAFATTRTAGGPTTRTTTPEPYVSSLTLSTDGAWLVAGGESGRCYIWAASTGDLFSKFDAHFQRVTCMAFTDDDELLITAGADATVNAYSVAELVDVSRDDRDPPRPKQTFLGHTLPITALSVGFGGSSARLLTASADRTARIWHLASATCIATILLPCAATDAVMNIDESTVYIGVQDGRIFVADVASLPMTSVSYKSLSCLSPPVAPGVPMPSVTSMSLSPLCTQLIVGYGDGLIRTYDTHSQQLLSTYGKHSTTAPITCVRTMHPVPTLRDVAQEGARTSAVNPQALPMASNVMFSKTTNSQLMTGFAPLVVLPGSRTVRDAACDAIDTATDMVFEKVEQVARIVLPVDNNMER